MQPSWSLHENSLRGLQEAKVHSPNRSDNKQMRRQEKDEEECCKPSRALKKFEKTFRGR